MLPHTSGLLKSIKLFFAWPLFLLGVKREADAVFISCMNFYEVCSYERLYYRCIGHFSFQNSSTSTTDQRPAQASRQ